MARRLGAASIADHLLPRDNVRVVMTHSVPHDHFGQFSQILDGLSSTRAWLDPADFLRKVAKDSPSEHVSGRSLVLTFDDGLLSSYEAAKSILGPRGIRAIFFVPTRILELRTRTQMRDFVAASVYYGARPIDSFRPEEYLTMSAEQLRDLHRDGHMILPHTHSHVLVREIATERDVERELIRPRGIIEDLLGSPADALALPVGTPPTVSAFAYRQIANAYSACFTAVGGANTSATNPLFIRRDSIHPWYSVEHAENIVDGLYDPYFGLRGKALRRRAGCPRRLDPAERTPCEESPPSSGARVRFIRQVARAFREAQVDYVVLHRDHDQRDSDLDLAVGRASLDVADAIIRSGALGRLVQCFHYDVPWCHHYVLESEEVGRKYRQIDLRCDPWGIGMYGATVREALARAVLADEVRVARPAAETLYLAAKRAQKRAYERPGGIDDLRDAFKRDPVAATELLQTHFGSAGRALASSLLNESDARDALARIRRRLVLLRSTPLMLARRASFGSLRVTRRLARPTGLAVAIVGGSDKTRSLMASGIERESEGAFRRTLTLRSHRRAYTEGSQSAFLGALLSFAALSRWCLRVPPARARATLITAEDRWLDLSRPRGGLLPRPDLTLFLADPASLAGEHMLHREVEETTHRSKSGPLHRDLRRPGRVELIESSLADVALERAVAAVNDCLAARQRRHETR